VFEITDGARGSSPTVREGVSPTVKVIAWYPKDKDPLLSGWLLGGDRIKGKAALVEVGMGKGRIILFGFRPQYRGQSLATYPLFFNAIAQPNTRSAGALARTAPVGGNVLIEIGRAHV